ncbi:ATP-binding protein [Calidifontibacter terrae]
MRYRTRKLSSQFFLAQLVILAITISVGFVLLARAERELLDTQYESRAAAIAQTVASAPTVRSCLEKPTAACRPLVQQIATEVSQRTGASYVVVIDMNRVRFSHPDPALIGQQVEEPVMTRDGRVHLGIDNGSTGRSANGKAPLYGPTGVMVGEISVGLRESSVSQALWSEIPTWALWFAVALAVGALASWLFASQVKKRTFGLELHEIAQLLQEREATLHGIREGVVAFDENERVSVVNDEAHRLLPLPINPVGSPLREVMPDDLRDRLVDPRMVADEIVYTRDRCLVVNRMPITLAGQSHGSVVTLRDQTELVGLQRELAGQRGLTESLRAQQHEFANRMHAVSGLLQLGRTTEALDYLLEIRGTAADFDNSLRERIAAPQIVGLLMGKVAEASEAGVEVRIAPTTRLSASPRNVHYLVSILGNLIDNAIQALASAPPPRLIDVAIVEAGGVRIQVSDNGPGIAPGSEQEIFLDGYSTKAGGRRGTGLAVVHRMVSRLGGTISVSTGPGARFTVALPDTYSSETRAELK